MKGHNRGGVCKRCGKVHIQPNGMLDKKHSNETRRKMSERLKGRRRSIKTEFKKGCIPWNKGKKVPERSGENHHFKKNPEIIRRIQSNPNVRKNWFKKGITPWNKDKTSIYSEEQLKNIIEGTRVAMKNPEVIDKIKKARLKQIFPKKDTKIERLMQEELMKRGIKFNKHMSLFSICQVDIAIPEDKIAIFCDGDFWHVNPNWLKNSNRKKLTKPQIFNIRRDKLQNKILKEKGWLVLRFWESDIISDASLCVSKVMEILNKNILP